MIKRWLRNLGWGRGSEGVRTRVIDPKGDYRDNIFEHLPLVIGQGEAADLQIRDRWVSSVHCELRWERDSLLLRDMQSSNGTTVNGALVRETEIQSGDVIRLGLSRIVVEFDLAAAHRQLTDATTLDP